jgi:hypothetical protein
MEKAAAQEMFKAYFDGLQAIYAYFGVKGFASYDYELQLMEDNWALEGLPISEENFLRPMPTLHHSIPDDQPEGTYQSPIHGIFRTPHFTLVFSPSGMGGAGFAHIFDNDKEIKDLQERDSDEKF